ncbi:MAG: hypothetical protein ACE5Q6_08455 [Dehalococcoidia bacterium]
MFRIFLISTLVSLVVTALIGIGIFILGDFGDTQVRLLLTTLVIGGFSLTGLANALRGGAWWLWALRPVGVAASVIALVMVLLRVWGVFPDERATWQSLGTLTVLAVTLAHISLLGLLRPQANLVRLWRTGALVAAATLAALIVAGLFEFFDNGFREPYFRLLGVVAILDVLGTIGLAPLSRLTPVQSARTSSPDRTASKPAATRKRRPPVAARNR